MALDEDLADLALRDLVAVVVDDLHLDAGDRRADRARLALAVGVVERRDRRGLGQAVALEHLAAERLLEAAQDLDRHRRAARGADAQRRDVDVVAVGVVQQRAVHRRHALEDRAPSRSRISSALAGSKRGSSVIAAPLQIAAFIVQVWPKE